MRHHHRAIIFGALLLGGGHAASAQQTQAGGQGQPAPATDAQEAGTLSDKLSTTNGVIHPDTNVDPGMGKTPPNPNIATMPVIPPPGTAGGAPGVQPK